MSVYIDNARKVGVDAFPSFVVGGIRGGCDDFEPGYCYLSIVKSQYASVMKASLGPWPLVQDILHHSLSKFDVPKLLASTVVRRASVWHFAADSDIPVKQMFRAVVAAGSDKYVVGSLGCTYQSIEGLLVPSGIPVGKTERLGGNVELYCPELVEMRGKSFDQCRCMVHSVPLTKPEVSVAVEEGFTTGCVQKPAGKAGVLANAYLGKPGMCHADTATREADKRFLGFVVSDEDPGLLDGLARPPEFAKLCTSSLTTDSAAFGNGYCYLDLLHKDTWWRAARLLGPNPLLRSVYRVLLWAGKPTGKKHRLQQVSKGFFHVTRDKEEKGVSSNAGRAVANLLLSLISQDSGARLGGVVGSRMITNHAEEATVGCDPARAILLPPGVPGCSEVVSLGFSVHESFAQYVTHPVNLVTREAAILVPAVIGKPWTVLVISGSVYDAFESVVVNGTSIALDGGETYWLLSRGDLAAKFIVRRDTYMAAVNILHLDLYGEDAGPIPESVDRIVRACTVGRGVTTDW